MKKKLLYISVNSKPEELSASKTVARSFINSFMDSHGDFTVEEVDLYKDHIPRLEYEYFQGRNSIINEESAKDLNREAQKEIKRIRELCHQFKEAQVYVIAAPMWSLSFPAPLKEYIDCIIQAEETISFEGGGKPKGLLGDKPRALIYVQSSGGSIPWILDPIMDKGENYVKSIMKFIGIKQVIELKVDNTGITEEEKQAAIDKAEGKIMDIVNDIKI